MVEQERIDPVTGGYPEAWLVKKYTELMESGQPGYGLMGMKIKRFGVLNRIYGKEAGDRILRYTYETIAAMLQPDEYVVRAYAHCFNILLRLPTIDDIRQRVVEIIKKVRDNPPPELGLSRVFVGVGVMQLTERDMPFHVAQYNAELCRAESLQSRYRDSHYEIYGYTYLNPHELFVDLENMILPAVQAGHFKLYLQPKVDIHTGQVTRAEALMRWVDPQRGMIPLASFLPGLEENGYIRMVDLYLFQEVCKTLERWQQTYGKQIDISVNLSKAYFEDKAMLEDYLGVFDRYQVPAASIQLEFVENIVMERLDHMSMLVDRLRKRGFRCALDDFGCGYSTFSVLTGIQLDELKIDRALFSDFSNPRERAVVRNIIATAKELQMTAVAEGVETMEYVDFLRSVGCDYIQGFVFYRPMPVDEFEEHFVRNDEKALEIGKETYDGTNAKGIAG